MCIYIYSFPPLSRNNRSRFETSYSRISIGDRDASRRQKASEREEKKEREGRRNNFAGTGILLLLLLRGWDRIFEKHAGKGSGGN